MAGTRAGGLKAAAKIKASDPDFYVRIGTKGGKIGTTGGFAAGEEGRRRASYYGAIGGKRGKPGTNNG
jgi:hypothetical protein